MGHITHDVLKFGVSISFRHNKKTQSSRKKPEGRFMIGPDWVESKVLVHVNPTIRVHNKKTTSTLFDGV